MAALADLHPDHDLRHLEAALRYVTDWPCAVDGGAHVGIWTRVLAQRFAFVLAVEPCADNYARLPEWPNVLRQHAALGYLPHQGALLPGEENTGQWHLSHGIAFSGPGHIAQPVEVLPLDQIAPAHVGFIKLDVEGMEAHALMGARETIRRCRPVVLIEENGLCARYGIRPGAAGRLLQRWGYRLAERLNKDYIYTPAR